MVLIYICLGVFGWLVLGFCFCCLFGAFLIFVKPTSGEVGSTALLVHSLCSSTMNRGLSLPLMFTGMLQAADRNYPIHLPIRRTVGNSVQHVPSPLLEPTAVQGQPHTFCSSQKCGGEIAKPTR